METRRAIEMYAHPLERFQQHYLDEVIAAEAMIQNVVQNVYTRSRRHEGPLRAHGTE